VLEHCSNSFSRAEKIGRWSSRAALDDWLHTVKIKAMPLIQIMVNRVLILSIALPGYQGCVPAPG
jgi:hypothetical protein